MTFRALAPGWHVPLVRDPSKLFALISDLQLELPALIGHQHVAELAGSAKGPFRDFYSALLAQGMKPTMARLTLARKIAAITLLVWKKGVSFDAQQLKRQVSV
jgi:hypothetical protein